MAIQTSSQTCKLLSKGRHTHTHTHGSPSLLLLSKVSLGLEPFLTEPKLSPFAQPNGHPEDGVEEAVAQPSHMVLTALLLPSGMGKLSFY